MKGPVPTGLLSGVSVPFTSIIAAKGSHKSFIKVGFSSSILKIKYFPSTSIFFIFKVDLALLFNSITLSNDSFTFFAVISTPF